MPYQLSCQTGALLFCTSGIRLIVLLLQDRVAWDYFNLLAYLTLQDMITIMIAGYRGMYLTSPHVTGMGTGENMLARHCGIW